MGNIFLFIVVQTMLKQTRRIQLEWKIICVYIKKYDWNKRTKKQLCIYLIWMVLGGGLSSIPFFVYRKEKLECTKPEIIEELPVFVDGIHGCMSIWTIIQKSIFIGMRRRISRMRFDEPNDDDDADGYIEWCVIYVVSQSAWNSAVQQ